LFKSLGPRWSEEFEENLNIIGIKKQAGNGQRPSGMEEVCTGRQGPQRTVKKKKKALGPR
jgi:hypothetical protein